MTGRATGSHSKDLPAVGPPKCTTVKSHNPASSATPVSEKLAGAIVRAADDHVTRGEKRPECVGVLSDMPAG